MCSPWSSPSFLTTPYHSFLARCSEGSAFWGKVTLPQRCLHCKGSLWTCRCCYWALSPALGSPDTAGDGTLGSQGPPDQHSRVRGAEVGGQHGGVLCLLPAVLRRALQVGKTKKMWLYSYNINALIWKKRKGKGKQSQTAPSPWSDLSSQYFPLPVSSSSDLHGLIEVVFCCLFLPCSAQQCLVFWPRATGRPEKLSSQFLSPSPTCCVGVGFFPTLPVLTVLLIYPTGHH